MKKTILGVLFIALIAVGIQGCVKAGMPVSLESSLPTISVQGKGEVQAVPDEAVIWFGVTSDEKLLTKAYTDNTTKMNAVIMSVKNMGIDSQDIKTSSYTVTPVYSRDENGRIIPGKPASFSVSQQLTVKVRDITKTGQVIDKVIASGTNTFGGLSFDSSKIDELTKQAKVKAAEDARKEAKLIADSLGVKIGRVIRISASTQQPYLNRNVRAFAVKAEMAAPQIEAGSMEVTSTCNVVYEIVQ